MKGKSRIFLLNCKGYQNGSKLSKEEKSQLDIMLAICQIIILIEDPSSESDVTELGYTHLNDSFHRLYSDNKNKDEKQMEICWPKSIFVLYNETNSIKKHQQSGEGEKELCKMFKDYNFSILHSQNATDQQQIRSLTSITNPLDELYLKNTSIVFREIYQKISPKNYLNMKFNGLSTPHILTELTYTMNQHNTSYFPKAFDKAKRSVLSSVYNRHALTYLLKMKEYISEEKPYSTDFLLEAFQTASEETIEEYEETQNEIVMFPLQDSLCLEYEKKLEDYIEEKEKNILAVNSKKSYKELMEIIPQNIVDSDPYGSVSRVKASFTPENRHFDNNAETEAVANALKSLYSKSNGSLENKVSVGGYTENDIRQKKELINKKRQELLKFSQLQIQQEEIMKQTNYYIQEEKQVQNQIQEQQEKIRILKSQMNTQKSGNESLVLYEETKMEVEELKRMLNAKLGQKKEIESVMKSGISPEVEILQSKLNSKRQEVQMIKSTFKPQSDQSSVVSAERRLIQPGSHIRRTHNSKI